MTPVEIVALINALLGVAFKLYQSVSQIQGDEPIPSWEDLIKENALLQAQIDEEMKKG